MASAVCSAARAAVPRRVGRIIGSPPNTRFPAAVDDAIAALDWVSARAGTLGIDPGTPRGRRRKRGRQPRRGRRPAPHADHGPALRFQLLIYPVTDTRTDTGSYEANAQGYMLERAGMRWFFDQYAPDPAQRDDPRLAVLRAPSHSGLPPAHVVTAGFDPLCDDGAAYARVLEAAAVPVTLAEHPTLIHGFIGLGTVVEGSRVGRRRHRRRGARPLRPDERAAALGR